MTGTLQRDAERVLKAVWYRDVFEDLSSPEVLKRSYRKWARVLHPDRYTLPGDAALANEAFIRLGILYAEAERAIASGNPTAPLLSITTKRAQHDFVRPLQRGDLTDIYAGDAELRTGERVQTVGKFARMPSDKDLLQTEAAAIRRLRGPDGDTRRFPFIPELVDTFTYGERGRPARQVNVLRQLDGFYNLTEIERMFPTGIHPLDMVWIWRRLLLVLGYAHGLGIMHGAVFPAHVMILPEQHGLVLADWSYASICEDSGQPLIKAIVETNRGWYPSEVLAKTPPSAATDIMLAARTMVVLLGGDPLTGNFTLQTVPRPLRAFFKGCLAMNQAARPDDAWQLLREFDELLQQLGEPYYPRRFRPFVMPTGIT